MLPVSHPTPGASINKEEENVDLKQALEPLLLSQGFKPIEENFLHTATGYEVDMAGGRTSAWMVIYDADLERGGKIICEAQIDSPAQALQILAAFGLLAGVEVTGADAAV